MNMAPRQADPVAVQANSIRFDVACGLAGVDVPPASSRGSRAWCPFGEFSHPDGGKDKALRVYPDHGYCFACALYLTPVRLYALVRDVDEETAARQLLQAAGLAPESYQQRWEQAIAQGEDQDLASLADALRVWLAATYPDWAERQYEPVVAGRLAWCLGLLRHVRTSSDCRYWLSQSRSVMQMVLAERGGKW